MPPALSPEITALALVWAILLDVIIGDPAWMPHAVRWIGRLIAFLDKYLNTTGAPRWRARLFGALTALVVIGLVYVFAQTALTIAASYSQWLLFAVTVYVIWSGLAITSLSDEAMSVINALKAEDLPDARKKLSCIVGRDTQDLDEKGMLRAVIETVSENTSDGVVAPLFYFALGGAPGMLAYKAVNTLDSMLGYRNERYQYFGWASARIDDAANLVPARLTALIMVVASFILGLDWRSSLRIWMRDGGNHQSPNSGRPEASASGALGVALGGPLSYNGVRSEKPLIGAEFAAPDIRSALNAVRLMRATAWIAALMAFIVTVASR
ncbi:MAG: cobalamin biosynthesis protein CobD [Deltaproteobacteria bacterium]|nr:cobalamin biosynthesis protein CobD [Deltaproteobacteria bacterium]